jgi:septal ring factor EnvC (AmiA/AmiB activator)
MKNQNDIDNALKNASVDKKALAKAAEANAQRDHARRITRACKVLDQVGTLVKDQADHVKALRKQLKGSEKRLGVLAHSLRQIEKGKIEKPARALRKLGEDGAAEKIGEIR